VLQIIIIGFIAITVGSFIFFTRGSDPETILFDRIDQLEQHYFYLILLLLALTLLSNLTGLPVFYFGIGLGFLLPFIPAALIFWGITLLSCMATFYMVRFAFYRYFKKMYGKTDLIKLINKRIRKYGVWSVVLSRGVYIIPANIINFSFPISKISTKHYFLGTLVGIIPEVLINVFIGYLFKNEIILLSTPEKYTWEVIAIGGIAIILTFLLIVLRIRQKRKKDPKPIN